MGLLVPGQLPAHAASGETPSPAPSASVDDLRAQVDDAAQALESAGRAADAALERSAAERRDADEAAVGAAQAQDAATTAAAAEDAARARLAAHVSALYRSGMSDPALAGAADALHAQDTAGLLSALGLLQRVTGAQDDAVDSLHSAERAAASAASEAALAAQRAAEVAAAAEQARAAAEQVVLAARAQLQSSTAALDAAEAAAEQAAACPGGDLTGAPNGQLPLDALCELANAPGQLLRADAAAAFDRMSTAYAQELGAPLCVTDSYRDLAAQVAVAAAKPALAAVPGTSNHGWGTAVDLCGGVEEFGTPQHAWLAAHAPAFGWFHPAWAQVTGSKPEPWHWEFAGL